MKGRKIHRAAITPHTVCVLLIVIVCAAISASAQQYSLPDVLNKIEQQNPQLLSYRNSIKSANERAKGARAWMPPRATAEWDDVPYNYDLGYRTSQLRFAASQDIPNARRNNARAGYLQSLAA